MWLVASIRLRTVGGPRGDARRKGNVPVSQRAITSQTSRLEVQ